MKQYAWMWEFPETSKGMVRVRAPTPYVLLTFPVNPGGRVKTEYLEDLLHYPHRGAVRVTVYGDDDG